MSEGGGFLARWSRRKAGLERERAADPASAVEPDTDASSARAPGAAASGPGVREQAAGAADAATAADVAPVPLPTLADAEALTRESDYTRFMLPGVDGGVRNAAMKKLFSDPHFNVMDGLDTYIDDYGKPDPLPLAMLRRMHQSAALGLFADEPEQNAAPLAASPGEKACPDGGPPAEMAPSTFPEPLPAASPSRAEDDPDLRLQPDHADRRPGAGAGAGN